MNAYPRGIAWDGRRMLEVIEGLPEEEREAFDLGCRSPLE
jgi:hypothetical protein